MGWNARSHAPHVCANHLCLLPLFQVDHSTYKKTDILIMKPKRTSDTTNDAVVKKAKLSFDKVTVAAPDFCTDPELRLTYEQVRSVMSTTANSLDVTILKERDLIRKGTKKLYKLGDDALVFFFDGKKCVKKRIESVSRPCLRRPKRRIKTCATTSFWQLMQIFANATHFPSFALRVPSSASVLLRLTKMSRSSSATLLLLLCFVGLEKCSRRNEMTCSDKETCLHFTVEQLCG